MKTQFQVSLMIAGALLFGFMVFSLEQYAVLLVILGGLALALLARAIVSGSLSPSNIRRARMKAPEEVVEGPTERELMDHSYHRIYPVT